MPALVRGLRPARKPAAGAQLWQGDALTRGLLACWLCNDGGGARLRDSTGRYHGTIPAGTVLWSVDDVFRGRVIRKTSQVAPVSVALPALTRWTVEAWLRRDNVAGYGAVLTQGGTRGMYTNTLSGGTYRIDWYDGGSHLNTSTIAAGVWVQLVVTYDGTALRFYVQGRLDGVTTFAASAFSATVLGGEPTAGALLGNLSLVRVWSRPLATSEVRDTQRDPWRMFAAPRGTVRVTSALVVTGNGALTQTQLVASAGVASVLPSGVAQLTQAQTLASSGAPVPPEPPVVTGPARGVATIAGFAHESADVWPVTSGALVRERWPLTRAIVSPGTTFEPSVTLAHARGAGALDLLTQRPTVTLDWRLRYQGLEALLACALGYMPASYPQTLAPRAYRHVYEVSDELAVTSWPASDAQPASSKLVRRGTFAAWRQVSTWELRGCMVATLTLASDGLTVTGTTALLASMLSRASTSNTASSLHDAAPCGWPLVSAWHAQLLVAPYSASTPLSTTDALCVSQWALAIDNQLDTTYGPRTSRDPDEYTRSAPPIVTLGYTLPRYDSDVWLDRWQTSALLMASLVCTGPPIAGTSTPYRLACHFPALRLLDVEPDPVAMGLPRVTHTLRALVPASPAAGMPATTLPSPLAVELVTGAAQHPLLI